MEPTTDTQTTPESPRSLGDMLTRKPEAAGPDASQPMDTDTAPENRDTGESTPTDTDVGAGLTPDPDEKAPEAAQAPAKDYRFADHDAAEDGYRNLQSAFTRISQEKAEAEKRLKALEERAAQAKRWEEIDKDVEAFAADQHAAALAEIDRLDPEASDYQAQVAAINARTQRAIMAHERSLSNAPPEAAADTPDPPAGDTHQAPMPGEPDPAAMDNLRDEITRQVKAEKIDPGDPVFLSYAQSVPAQDETGRLIPIQEQVAEAVKLTKEYHARQRRTWEQERDAPLGSGGSKPPEKPEKVKQITLGAAIRKGRRVA
jgi:hypothetical protein